MSIDLHLPLWLAVITGEAKADAESISNRGFHRIVVGDFAVTAIYDGEAPLPIDQLLTGTTAADTRQLLAEGQSPSPVGISVNAYLVELGDRRIVIDTGAGTNFGSACGRFASGLKAAGYTPESVSDVLLTHIHPDHTGGLVGTAGMLFPKAKVFVNKIDMEYWFDPIERASATGKRKKMFDEGTAGVEPYLQTNRVTTFDAGSEILSGVHAIAAPGHTAGHTMYRVESDGHAIVFFGDLVHSAEVQMLDPSVAIKLDSDETQAVASRKRWLPKFADEGTLTAGAHTFFPGFGHVVRNGPGFAWKPLHIEEDHRYAAQAYNEQALPREEAHDSASESVRGCASWPDPLCGSR